MYKESRITAPPFAELYKDFETEEKFDLLLKREQVSEQDINVLNTGEREVFIKLLTGKVNEHETAHGRLTNLLSLLTAKDDNTTAQEFNYRKIREAITVLYRKHNTMPTKTQIADYTGLSRPTVHKYMKGDSLTTLRDELNEHAAYMLPRVLDKVLYAALSGNDLQAAKLYLNTISKIKNDPGHTTINNQNNYIQINGKVLNHEKIQQLKPEQLKMIEDIITLEVEAE